MRGKITWMSFAIIVLLLVGGIPAALAPYVPGTTETVKISLMDAANPGAAPVTYPDGQQYREINATVGWPHYAVGESFTVWVNVTDVTELNLYQVGLFWDSSILTCTSYLQGDFFLQAPSWARTEDPNLPKYWNNIDPGIAHVGAWALLLNITHAGNVTGTGTIAVAEFDVIWWGVTKIEVIVAGVEAAGLGDANEVPLDYNTIEIIFDNTKAAPGPYGPTADFTVGPPPPNYVGETLTFTGKNTSSEWGFSGFPDFDPVYIVSMDWDFGDGNFSSGLVVTNIYVTDGTFNVNLTVFDSRGWSDSIVKPVVIFPLAVGAVLDVYTQKAVYNGTGPFMPSRPFRANKEEEVILYAKVIYNDRPVVNKLVTFAVYQVNETALPSIDLIFREVRTALTDVDGIATISFRIPTGYNDEFHGAWAVFAYCFIAAGSPNALVFDAVTWTVAWVNEIVAVEPVPPASWHKCETAMFNVTVIGWDFIAQPLVISLTLHDDLNVTIAATAWGYLPPTYYFSPVRPFYGDGTLGGLIVGGMASVPIAGYYLIGAHIPMHTYVGIGTAYVNLFDNFPIPSAVAPPAMWPICDGQPWCPEASTIFGLE